MRGSFVAFDDPIPAEFGWPFLAWLRAATERAWSQVETKTFADYQEAGVGGSAWQRGTKWTSDLSDPEIGAIESRFGIRFAPDHRLFLKVLHATEPRCTGARFVEGDQMEAIERPGFYHWLRDEAAIRDQFEWLVDGLAFDVEHNVLWPQSWGARPESAGDRRARIAELSAKAPRLVPITGHRYVLADPPTLVLSVYQSDIIVYGSDLRAFLLNELYDLLGIDPDPSWMNADARSIPFWGELIELNGSNR
jgi:hypothetical protein